MSSTLKTQLRTKLGSRTSRSLRRDGRIPASLQATKESDHLNISLSEAEFMSSRRQHEHLYDLDIEGSMESAVVRELQWDTFGQSIVHVEFQRVVRGVEMESEVELVFEGMPKTGQLNHLITHITISSIPSKIPDNIEVLVSELEIGATVLVSDLKLPEGVSAAVPADTKVAVVRDTAKAVEEDDEAEAEEGEAPAAE